VADAQGAVSDQDDAQLPRGKDPAEFALSRTAADHSAVVYDASTNGEQAPPPRAGDVVAQKQPDRFTIPALIPMGEIASPAARALAREIAAKTAPVSVALIRQMMWRGLGMDHPMEAHKVDSRGIYSRGASADVKEGVVSFLEKRPAKFPQKVSADMPPYFPWWQPRKYS